MRTWKSLKTPQYTWREKKCEIFSLKIIIGEINNHTHKLQEHDDYDGHGMEIIAIEEQPPTQGQISISSSLNQLGKRNLAKREAVCHTCKRSSPYRRPKC